MGWKYLKSSTSNWDVLLPFRPALLPSPAYVFLLLSYREFIWFAIPAQNLFIWGFFCWFYHRKGVGQSSKSSAFWWWQAIISGQLSARHSVTQGMNPWSQVWCSCCWEVGQGPLWTTWAKSKRRQQSSELVQQQRKRMTACRTSLFTEK